MDYSAYKLTWHIVLIPEFCGTYIKGVYGSDLLEDAQKSAAQCGGEVRSLSVYGCPFHVGQMFKF